MLIFSVEEGNVKLVFLLPYSS